MPASALPRSSDTPRTRSTAAPHVASMSGTAGGGGGGADAITNIFSPLSSVALAQIAKEAKAGEQAAAEEPTDPPKFTPHRITSAQILLMLKTTNAGGGGGAPSADDEDGIPPPPHSGFGPAPSVGQRMRGSASAGAGGTASAMPPPMPVRSSSRREARDMNSNSDKGGGSSKPKQSRKTTSNHAPTTGDDPGCNCKKSRCLKLYCQCFAQDALCKDICKCVACLNTEATILERDDARRSILSRNPAAFATKINDVAGDGKAVHKLGCKCRKSACLKKYCECFHAGVTCGPNCSCVGCKNMGPGSNGRDQGATDSASITSGTGRAKNGSKRRAIAAAPPQEKRSPNDHAALEAAEDLFCMKTGSPRKEAAARKAELEAKAAEDRRGESLGSKQPKDGFFAHAVSLNFGGGSATVGGSLNGMTVMVEASTREEGASFRDSGSRGSAKRPRSVMEGEGLYSDTAAMPPPPPPPTHPPPSLEAPAAFGMVGGGPRRGARDRGFRVVPRVGGEVINRSENENGSNQLGWARGAGADANATYAKGRRHTRDVSVSQQPADFLQCTESIEGQGEMSELGSEYGGERDSLHSDGGTHSDGDGEGVEGVRPAPSAGLAVTDDSASAYGGSSAGLPLTLPSETSPNTSSSPTSPGGGGDPSGDMSSDGGESRKRRREGSIDHTANGSPKSMRNGMRAAHGMVARDQPATVPVRG